MIADARQIRSLPSRQFAFTLVEVMVSLALMVILMLAVNYIFSSVGRATSATQALSRATRDAQSAQAIMFRDFASADMKNAPFVVLRSESVPAFRNAADRLAGPNNGIPANPLIIDDPNGTGTTTSSAAIYNDRNHRIDVFSFFSRDTFQRQTGGGTISGAAVERYVDPMSCPEAWVWYGHLNLPNNNGSFSYSNGVGITPGSGDYNSNPNNFHANQFILGRVAMLLQEPDATTSEITTYEKAGSSASTPPKMDHTYYFGTGAADLRPFAYDTQARNEPATTLRQARYDLIGASMGTYRTYLQSFIAANPTTDWWDPIMLAFRYQASPYILNTGTGRLSPQAVAQQAPIFLTGCSQFIVEYAGDFIAQDNDTSSASYGELVNVYFDTGTIAPSTDGETDYVLDGSKAKSVRWYGLPRDIDGDGRIQGSGVALGLMRDVVPLRDVLRSAASPAAPATLVSVLQAATTSAPFERFVDYANATLPTTTYLQERSEYAQPSGKASNEFYTCAWGPGDRKPTMIRVTFVLDDPDGQLSQPQTYEYLFKVQ